jgi:hypothetical protein
MADLGFRRAGSTFFPLFIGTSLAVGLCFFVNYLSFFVLSPYASHYTSLTSVIWEGHTYRLDMRTTSDDSITYYFGKCDQSGNWCEFQPFYEDFFYHSSKPQIMLSDDSSQVIIKFDDHVVYRYDGQTGDCFQVTVGQCREHLQ